MRKKFFLVKLSLLGDAVGARHPALVTCIAHGWGLKQQRRESFIKENFRRSSWRPASVQTLVVGGGLIHASP